MNMLLHQEPIVVRWGDLDLLGHVNNAVYFMYFEHARGAWMSKNGLRVREDNTAPVLIKTQAIFLKSITFPETVVVSIYLTAIGQSSFNTSYVIHSQADDSIIYTKGTAKIVWVDQLQEKSVLLPEDVRATLEKSIR